MTRNEVWEWSCRAAIMASTAKTKPKNAEPTSPMKIRAGGKLKIRKPNAPAPIA